MDGLPTAKIAATTSDAGVYDVITGFPCPCRIVVCDELDVNEANIPLLTLGSVGTVKKAIVQLARAGPEMRCNMGTIKSLTYYFYYDEVKDMTEMKEFTPADIRRNVTHAIEDIGIEKVINDIGIKMVVEAVGVEKVIAVVGVEKVIGVVGVEKVIDAVGEDKLKAALARREVGKKPMKKVK